MMVIAKTSEVTSDSENTINPIVVAKQDEPILITEKNEISTGFKQKITGSIAASSYSNFSNTDVASSTRYQYLLSLNARNISDSKVSVESSISFRHQKDKWFIVQDNVFNALKVYNLSVKYDNNKTKLVFGRKINSKISSIGAVDGIQFEQRIRDFSVGAILGFRPDYADYGFNFNLPQYGVYFSHNHANSNGEIESSFAIVEQMNANKTDRRFAYFQQTNSLLKNLYFFGSVEVDLYKNIDDQPENTFSLSSTYLSLNYKPSRKISLSTSYDNRKNVVYYETYKSFINQLIEIEARQGLGFQVNYFTLKDISFGLKTGYRFPNRNSRETKNLYGYFSYSNVPMLDITSTLSANYIESSYVKGKMLNLNISRDFYQSKFYSDFGYQWVSYQFLGGGSNMVQNVFNLGVSWRFYKKLTFSGNYEYTMEASDHYNRLVLQLRQRF
jgi:hypothetical protein